MSLLISNLSHFIRFFKLINSPVYRLVSYTNLYSRYTANDPCHPRCEFLYKDHYHCNLPTCSMIFRAKEGVRDHARSSKIIIK